MRGEKHRKRKHFKRKIRKMIDLPKSFTNNVKRNLAISFMNIDGLGHETMIEINNYVSEYNPDVLLLNETKRREDEVNEEIIIPGYIIETRQRSGEEKGGGGILTAWKSSLSGGIWQANQWGKEDVHKNERLWLLLDGDMRIAICNTYWASESKKVTDFKDWNEELSNKLSIEADVLKAEGFHTIWTGDFNSHIGTMDGKLLNKPDINTNGKKALNFMKNNEVWLANSLQTVGDSMTRYQFNEEGLLLSESLLDLIMIDNRISKHNVSFKINRSHNINNYSDHRMIEAKLIDWNQMPRRLYNKPEPKFSINEKSEYENFAENVRQRSSGATEDGFRSQTNEQKSIILRDILLGAAEESLPYKKKDSRNLRIPEALRLKLKEKKIKWEQIKAGSRDPATINSHENLKEEVKSLRMEWRMKRKQKLKEKIVRADPTRKTFWKVARNKLQKGIRHSVMRNSRGELTFSDEQIGEAVRDAFKLRLEGSDEPVKLEINHPSGRFDNEMASEVTLEELQKTISSMKSGKAADQDGLKIELFKHAPPQFLELLRDWINATILTGEIPDHMKGGIVKLLYKKDDAFNPCNYRPITISNMFAKILTKIMNVRISEIIEREFLLSDNQFGFRKERSTVDAVFILASIIEKAKHMEESVHVAFIDLEAAYDRYY